MKKKIEKFFANLLCAFIPFRYPRKRLREFLLFPPPPIGIEAAHIICKKLQLISDQHIYTLLNGVKFYCKMYPHDFIQREIVDTGRFFEYDLLNSIIKYTPPRSVILDIGANIGNHSIYWAMMCDAKEIHSFEPMNKAYQILCENVRINNLENIITTYNIALGSQKGYAMIKDFYPNNIGRTSIVETTDGVEINRIKIEALDEMNIEFSHVNFVKIDVEGYELNVLEGMRKLLMRHRPIVFIECFPKNLDKAIAFFGECGYGMVEKFSCDNYIFRHY